MTAISVLSGDITRIPADALITGVTSDMACTGVIDDAIRRVAGDGFHRQLRARPVLRDGMCVYAPELEPHDGSFRGVLFVVDDLQVMLRKVVVNALAQAGLYGLRSVSLPLMRTGAAAECHESPDKAVQELMAGVGLSTVHRQSPLEQIFIVVYNDKKLAARLTSQAAGLTAIMNTDFSNPTGGPRIP